VFVWVAAHWDIHVDMGVSGGTCTTLGTLLDDTRGALGCRSDDFFSFSSSFADDPPAADDDPLAADDDPPAAVVSCTWQ